VSHQSGDAHVASVNEADARFLVEGYVAELKAGNFIQSPAVERALRKVHRHRFLQTFYRPPGPMGGPPIHHDPDRPLREHLELIYSDTALGTRFVNGAPTSSTSQPSIVTTMLELLDLVPQARVLEIGAGTGYNAALISEIVGGQRFVVTVDVQDDVVEQTRLLLAKAGYDTIRVLLSDGFEGAPEQAPFDRIMATVGCSDLSPKWMEQLAEGGLLLVPLAHAGSYPLCLLRRERGRLVGRVASWASFMPVHGRLHIDGLWPRGISRPGSGESIRRRDPWPGFAVQGSLPELGRSADEIDFCFYLSLVDRRAYKTPSGVGLSEGVNGWAMAGPDGISWWRNAALADDLDRLHTQWLASGRPTFRDYRMAFVPIEASPASPAGGWTIHRRYFSQLIWLDPEIKG
jgi:protein-L-isoaspartate(D-aspartate) O-methyltransferase